MSTDDNGFMLTMPVGKIMPDSSWATLLHPDGFDRDLLAGLKSSHLLHNFFRYVANTGLLVLRRAGGRSLRRSRLAWNSRKIFERLYAADRGFPLLRETFRTIGRDVLDVPGARDYLAQVEGEPRVLHPPAASPFTFGIMTSSFGDSVMLDDCESMVEALHRRVLEVLNEHLPVQSELYAI
jgi:Lhr-like helicase